MSPKTTERASSAALNYRGGNALGSVIHVSTETCAMMHIPAGSGRKRDRETKRKREREKEREKRRDSEAGRGRTL